MQSLDDFAAQKLGELDRAGLRRVLADTTRLDGIWAVRGGRRLLSFCCNDYLNLTHHPAVKEAAIAALSRYGAGSGAARLVTGNHPLFAELEARLARLKGTAAACVFGSGYLANAGIIPALVGPDDLVLVDELSHACLWAGARLARATVVPFRHGDVAHAQVLLAEHRGRHARALIATDGVFSMDGDLAPLPALAALARRHDAWLMTDDAHGIGVIGGGRGATFAHGTQVDIPLQMGTLSKAVGGYGGYLCASAAVIDLIRNRARTFVYSTGLPPATVAAAIAAIEVIEREAAYCALPLAKARKFTSLLGLPEATSPIVPLLIGEAEAALAASRLLEAEGFLVIAIRPPTVPAGTARLRFTFTAGHPDAEIVRLAEIVRSRITPSPRLGGRSTPS
ncbi:MAG: 8-amino-7-oxononanoate synthase [Alphaproteobacteria bacterium]|jgi:8-amino-7-oxononanoate synthase|nr:8-amino-7-oxononanoate synthase [Alphaproteobacteria bacterium]